MTIQVVLLAGGFLRPVSLQASQVVQRLYINRGIFVTVKGTTFPALAYNNSQTFNKASATLRSAVGDTLLLVVTNDDSTSHSIAIRGLSIQGRVLLPNERDTLVAVFPSQGTYILYDPIEYPKNKYMGLAALIAVTGGTPKSYYWNLREFQLEFSQQLGAGKEADWTQYDPDYFAINGLSYPEIQADTLSAVHASVGERVLIHIANTGQSEHALHFHGYHLKVLATNGRSCRVGWIKDSFPIRSMETLLLELIPDKPGRYSVHDHNLVAVSAGGTHPNGMFTIMEVQ